MKQRTLKRAYNFEGKGLHTGTYSHICIKPAPAGSGIKFIRTDVGRSIPALAEYVSNTARCTLISDGRASVSTIEHIMSAFTGMGIDNAVVEVDNLEIPILDGSARFYVEAFAADGLVEQEAERRYFDVKESLELRHEATGSWIKIEPSDKLSFDLTVDFGSRVLGVQKVHWDESVDYATEIAVCRTFVFFHEVQYLAAQGLVKGGDVDNAIVGVERPVPEDVVADLALEYRVESRECIVGSNHDQMLSTTHYQQPTFMGYSYFRTGSGVYKENILWTDEQIEATFPVRAARERIEPWLEVNVWPRYHGPLGVDLMVCADGSVHVAEINFRHTMGMVAHEKLKVNRYE